MPAMTIRARRTRKALFVLPLFITPFLCLAFWAVGGGRAADSRMGSPLAGLNLNLPDPFFSDNAELDKWAYYSKEEELAKQARAMQQKDPYRLELENEVPQESATLSRKATRSISNRNPITRSAAIRPLEKTDDQSKALLDKLAELEARLAEDSDHDLQAALPPAVAVNAPSVEGFNDLMASLQSEADAPDPEMDRLDSMLDKVLQIQQGGWPTDAPQPSTEAGLISQKQTSSQVLERPIQEPDVVMPVTENYFFSEQLSETVSDRASPKAMVYSDQVVVPGASVHLMVLDSVWLENDCIPAFSSMYGMSSLQGDRLLVTGKVMVADGKLHAVAWQLVDMDGLPGIAVPSSLTRESLRQSAGQAVQGVDIIGGFNPSLSAQAAVAGVQAAKSLLSKRTRQVKVNLPAGYKVWIALQ